MKSYKVLHKTYLYNPMEYSICHKSGCSEWAQTPFPNIKMKTTLNMNEDPKNEDDPKNKDKPKKKMTLRNKDDLKNKVDLYNNDNL